MSRLVRNALALVIALTAVGCHYDYRFVDPHRASEPGWRQVRAVPVPATAAAPTAADALREPAAPKPAPQPAASGTGVQL